MEYTLKELLDIPRLRQLLDTMDEIHSMPSAIIDIEGNILTATAWQDICTKFHRINPETEKKCIESDTHISAKLDKGMPHAIYRCPMGLVDSATPIIIEGKHLGNVFTGQLFVEPPDEEYFIKQARQYGFDENEYLEAMRKVPFFPEEKLHKNLTFIHSLTQMLAEQGLQYKRLCEVENALRERKQRYRDLFANAGEGIFILSTEGRLVEVNESFARMHGYSIEEMLQMGLQDLDTPETSRLVPERMSRLVAGEILTFEVEHYHKDGHIFPLEVTASLITSGGRQCFQCFHRDITERKMVENVLRESEEKHRILFENAGDAIFVHDENARMLAVNPLACERLGYTQAELMSLTINLVDTPEQSQHAPDRIARLLEHGYISFETVHQRKDGSSVPTDVSSRKISWDGKPAMLSICRDITDRKKAEEEKLTFEHQLQHTQKLESLGVLSGGIAHDFNNILAIIMGYCSLTKMDYETAEKNIPEIEIAAERAAGLCRQMLAYAGKAQLTKAQINMRMLVDEMVTMLKTTLPQNAEINTDLSTDVPSISGDASQIRQIIMNLIINASEAIGKEQGEIQVSLAKSTVLAGQSEKDYHGKEIPPGSYVYLEVTDNGCGMDEATKWRIFEPFYTTKFTGRGLGMSAVLGIIKSHNGALQLHSQLSQGTTFKVYLPIQKSDSPRDEDSSASIPSVPWKGSGTILLVEDEDQVRLIAKALLKNFGFNVLEAVNGKEALELYQRNANNITLVMTDMGMPIMDGYELFSELKKLNPELPIIVSSGYGDAEVGSRLGTDNIAGLISKPYGPEQLREMLKRVLEDEVTTVELSIN